MDEDVEQKHAGYPNDPDATEENDGQVSGDGACWVQGVNGVWVGQKWRDYIGDIHTITSICLFNVHERAMGSEPRVYFDTDRAWSSGDTLWALAERMDLLDPRTFQVVPHPLDWVYEPMRGNHWSRHGRERDWGKDGLVCNVRDRMKWISGRVARAPRSPAESNVEWAVDKFRELARIRDVDGKECREIELEFKEHAKYNWYSQDAMSGGPRCQAWSDRVILDDGKPYIQWFDWKKRVEWRVEKLDKKMSKFTFSFIDHGSSDKTPTEMVYPIPRLIESLKVGAEPAQGEQVALF